MCRGKLKEIGQSCGCPLNPPNPARSCILAIWKTTRLKPLSSLKAGKPKHTLAVSWLLITWTLVRCIVSRRIATSLSLTLQSMLMMELLMCSQFLIANRWILVTRLLKLLRFSLTGWMHITAVCSVSTTWTWNFSLTETHANPSSDCYTCSWT